jgi:amino acid transporter
LFAAHDSSRERLAAARMIAVDRLAVLDSARRRVDPSMDRLQSRVRSDLGRGALLATDSAAPDSPGPPVPCLVRAISRFDLTAGVVNAVVGAGIFGAPAAAAALAGAWSPLAAVGAAVGILTVVLCFAEVGSRFDESGGPYLYTREAFGRHVGFAVGWLHVWTRLLSAAAILNVFVAYLAPLLSWAGTPTGRLLVMTGVVVLVTAINVRGIRLAAWTVDAFTIAKLLPLGLLVGLGLPRVSGSVLATQGVGEARWTDAVLLMIFLYGGFESAVIAASETRDPRRHTASALLMALAVVSATYCLVQLVVVGVLPRAAAVDTPVAAALEAVAGPLGALLGSLAALVSGYGWLTGFAMMTPRILFAMGERGELPRAFCRVHARFRTPHVAVIANSAVALALALYGSFADAASLSVVTRLGIFGLTCATLPVLRRRRPTEAPAFRVPGGVVVAAAGILFCLWLLATRSFAQIWLLLVILAVGLLLRWWVARLHAGRARAA